MAASPSNASAPLNRHNGAQGLDAAERALADVIGEVRALLLRPRCEAGTWVCDYPSPNLNLYGQCRAGHTTPHGASPPLCLNIPRPGRRGTEARPSAGKPLGVAGAAALAVMLAPRQDSSGRWVNCSGIRSLELGGQ